MQQLRKAIDGLPSHFTLDACRHGGMTELEVAELTEGQGRALSGHKTAQAYRGYAKETLERALSATRKRHAHRLANETATNIRNEPRERKETNAKYLLANENSGWGAWIRTRGWRNQKLLPDRLNLQAAFSSPCHGRVTSLLCFSMQILREDDGGVEIHHSLVAFFGYPTKSCRVQRGSIVQIRMEPVRGVSSGQIIPFSDDALFVGRILSSENRALFCHPNSS